MTGNPEDPPFDVEETPIDQSEVTHARTDSHVRFEGIVDSLYEESPASPPRTDPEMNTEALPPHPHTDTTEKPYDWRIYRPRGSSMINFFRWLVVGGSKFAEQSDEEVHVNVRDLARCLIFLREYKQRYGIPSEGDVKAQEFVLRNVLRDLYAGGAPIWSLESVMQRAAEGLTGHPAVNWTILPRKAFMYHPVSGSTQMFKIQRGFCVQKVSDMEPVVVRLASFASNTRGVSNVPARFPDLKELRRVYRSESVRFGSHFSYGSYGSNSDQNGSRDYSVEETPAEAEKRENMAKTILDLASNAAGLFYFINAKPFEDSDKVSKNPLDKFWIVDEQERELFSRLAAIEALRKIEEIDTNQKELYPAWVIALFRVVSSAGACAFWFGGSWSDMLVSGILALVVAFIGSSKMLSKQERIIFEIVASFIVGFVSASIALNWPEQSCFGAMAISGVLDLLQGFRVVFAVVEIMSRNTLSGCADLAEGIMFTALIASSLRFGQYLSTALWEDDVSGTYFGECGNGIERKWFILLVPLAAISWSGLFTPHYKDLPIMAFHGSLAVAVNVGLSEAGSPENINNFASAMIVTFSAGIWSRFSGRQAVGNAMAGMFALVPGAYMVRSLYSSDRLDSSFFADIIQLCVVIGIGAWTGTILCSPTLLGVTRGLVWQTTAESKSMQRAESASPVTGTVLFF